MKSEKIGMMMRIAAAALLAATAPASGQVPVIASFRPNGELVCTNLQPGTTATVFSAESPLGPWTNPVPGLEAVAPNTLGAITVNVPVSGSARFYRVQGIGRIDPCLPPFPTPSGMVWIPCGTFTMGSPDSEPARSSWEGPQTQVTISHGFWMGQYEVTQGEYLTVMGINPSYFTAARGYGTNLSRPVETVSWDDAVAYCAMLTAREQSAGRLPAGYVYRLPTEAQWEYACRAGTTTPFHYGDALRSEMADFNCGYEYPPCGTAPDFCYNPNPGNCLGGPTSVGSFATNAWGLYDMHGNVSEWCQDYWAGLGAYPGGSVTDPQGPATGSYRVMRGGSWFDIANYCRSAYRIYSDPTYQNFRFGIRVVLAQGQP